MAEVFMTAEGKKKLEERLEYLKVHGRAEMAEKIRVAREFGDLSENAEYDIAKDEQAKMEAEILEIEGKQVREPDPDKIYLAWQDFDGNPMAGNIQWILYRNAAGRVLVKVLFNEREVALPLTSVSGPYYDWQEFERYYRAKIDRMPDLPPLPEVETGDLLVIHDTGAHGHAMGYQYNGRLRSAEVLLCQDGSTRLIRRAETPEDYFATAIWD